MRHVNHLKSEVYYLPTEWRTYQDLFIGIKNQHGKMK